MSEEKEKSEAVLIIRMRAAEKRQYQKQAKDRNISLTEMVLSALRNAPLKDYAHEKELRQIFHALINEINHVGNNINQATVTLHQLRISGLPESGEVKNFNQLQAAYMQLMEDYKKLLWEILKR